MGWWNHWSVLLKNDEGHNVTVNGDRYRALINNFFIPELNNHDAQELWFQQEGATCHTARATIDLLKDTFGDRLISRFGPVNWPPRSCDLTTLNYFLWGYVKSLVYADKPPTLDHLEDNIRRVIADIRPQMLEKVIENWTSDWTTSEPAVAVLCQKSYIKFNHETCYTSRLLPSSSQKVCFDKDNGKTSSFKPDAVPENHFHLGSHNYAVVSEFADVARIHLRRYKLDATGYILPTKDEITVTPSVWLALVKEFSAIDQAFDDGKVFVIKDCLLLSRTVIENVTYIIWQRYFQRKDFSRKFLTPVPMLKETEWNVLKDIHKQITSKTVSIMFGCVFLKLLRKKVAKHTFLFQNMTSIVSTQK
ncbi:putative transposable element [Trichonephila clavipes]|nr:putative transposable element [Trichonephila clavipes]